MVAPALLSLALGTLAVMAAQSPSLSVSPSEPHPSVPFNVTCSSGHLTDPSATAAITVDGADQPVTTDHRHGQATAVVTVATEGSVQLGCSVRAGGVESRTNQSLEVYFIPQPLLNFSGLAAPGSELRARCSLPPGSFRDIQVRLRLLIPNQTDLERPWAEPPQEFGFVLPEPDPEREKEELELELELELRCETDLGRYTKRNASRRVPLLARPRLEPRLCPAQQNWTEGQAAILQCRARGRPQPLLECSRRGDPEPLGIPVGTPIRAQPIHAGIYRCRAQNEAGVAESDVTVWVHAAAPAPLLPVLLGILLPLLSLLLLAGSLLLHRHRSRIGAYRLWKRQPPPPRHRGATPGPPGHRGATPGPPSHAQPAAGATSNGSP